MRRILFSCLTAFALLALPVLAKAEIHVTETSPLGNAANVDPAILTDILVRFDTTSLDEGSFTGTGKFGNADRVTVDNGASYTASLLDDTVGDYIKIHLNSPLKYSTTYTVKINWRVHDTDNNNLGKFNSYTFSFTTIAAPTTDTTPPTVESTFPLNDATNVPVSVVISVTFDELMATATIDGTTNLRLRVDSTSALVATTVSLDTDKRVAYITPSADLASNTKYRVIVDTAVTDVAGNNLPAKYYFYFTTMAVDTTAPTIVAVTPLNGATGVDVDRLTVEPNSKITVKFSEAMDSATITSITFTVGSVAGTVTYDPGTWTATFTPNSNLAYATNYTATVTTAVTDAAGNHMAANKTWSFTTVSPVAVPPLTDYCQIPAFITNNTSNSDKGSRPNVLIMLDNSGSMYEFAYKKAPSGNCNYGSNCYDDGYDSSVQYYGYFDNSKMYKYISANGHFEIDTTAGINKNSFWHGNFLNWLTMRRIDVVRKVLVGGKTEPRSANTANYLIAAEDPDRDHLKKYNNVEYSVEAGAAYEVIKDKTNSKTYNVKVYVGNQPPQDGLVLRYSDKINFGIMVFNDGYRFEDDKNSVRDGGNVAVDIGATGNNLLTQIEGNDPSTWTPLAETLYESTRYFQAITGAYNNDNYGAKDPILKYCQKNFVLILTDGESTKDQNVPGTSFTGGTAVTDPYGFDVKDWMDKIAANEGSGYTSQRDTSANTSKGTYYLEGVAYYAHSTDLRSSTMGKSDLAGNQNLTIYTVFAFDDSPVGKDLLKKTAKYGGFNDYNKTGKPDAQAKWDKDGDLVPDTYFEAQNGAALQASLTRAFNDILARVSSGTAASILSNSEGSGANILQAMFYPQKYFSGQSVADWIGELHSLWYYIDPFINNSTVREDSDYTDTTRTAPHYLDLQNDNLINFYFDPQVNTTMVARYQDVGGDGQPDIDTSSPADGVKDSYTLLENGVDPDSVKSLWRAGQRLFYRTPATRKILSKLSGSGTMVDFQTLIGDSSIIPYLAAANQTEANKIINYISGTDQSGFRSRTVTINGIDNVWKLGDIISSTPRLQSSIQLNTYNLPSSSGGYKDSSYGKFISQPEYAARGMVYVGANDGMLHAFKLGTLEVTPDMSKKATLSGSGLGEEKWAFIPKNALPYLRYLGDTDYSGFNHLYSVDGSVLINDVSIGNPSACTAANYYDCAKDLSSGSNWKTILIGSMGLGGASRIKGAGCKATTCVETPILDPTDNTKGFGYSSYFALDITDQYYDTSGDLVGDPKLMWEFSDPALGFATSGVAILRIATKQTDGVTPDPEKNGHWFAVIASGPTGSIDSKKFMGESDQPLTIFVLDLADGSLKRKFDTLSDGTTKITKAFAGSITAAPIDTERWNPNSSGNYQDNALYFGYTQYSGTTGKWTDGGVLRLVTNEDPDPANWTLSKVIDGVGPVVTNVSRLQDRKNHNLWLYFGTGRYTYPLDDLPTQRKLFGIKEPCYTSTNTIATACTTSITSGLVDQSDKTKVSNTMTASDTGWYINLEAEVPANFLGAERSVTDPVALTNGAVFFTTFQPSSDVCGFGGNSYLWGVNYNYGLELPEAAKEAKALIQVSTGSFEQVDIKNKLTGRNNRRTGSAMVGKPPLDPPPIVTKANLKPVKRILHIQEN